MSTQANWVVGVLSFGTTFRKFVKKIIESQSQIIDSSLKKIE